MYANDSFFDLSPWGQVGLLGISTVLFLLSLGLAWWLLRRRPIWIAIPAALAMFWAFVWLSPQVYYTYYRMIIPDLPLQWVIWPPPGIGEALSMLIFQGPQNLSAHSQGLLGWCLVAVPLLARWRR